MKNQYEGHRTVVAPFLRDWYKASLYSMGSFYFFEHNCQATDKTVSY